MFSIIEWIDPAERLPDDDILILGVIQVPKLCAEPYIDALARDGDRWCYSEGGIPLTDDTEVLLWAEVPFAPQQLGRRAVLLIEPPDGDGGDMGARVLCSGQPKDKLAPAESAAFAALNALSNGMGGGASDG